MSIARYKWAGNFTNKDLDGQIPAGFTAAIQQIGPEVVVDIEVLPQLTGSKDDLDTFMSMMGWTFVSEDPTDPVPASTTITISAATTLRPEVAYVCDTGAGGSFDVQLLSAAVDRGPVFVKNIGPNVLGIVPAATQMIDGEPRLELVNIYDAVTLYPDGVNKWWVW